MKGCHVFWTGTHWKMETKNGHPPGKRHAAEEVSAGLHKSGGEDAVVRREGGCLDGAEDGTPCLLAFVQQVIDPNVYPFPPPRLEPNSNMIVATGIMAAQTPATLAPSSDSKNSGRKSERLVMFVVARIKVDGKQAPINTSTTTLDELNVSSRHWFRYHGPG
ncbi:uncharacterized protein NECHADRAFT_81593 [Fusarium vanettenii 77-13-4]|uniref:Uncharacterized protein n=1 Tax=Fusarium vanettenii (strain ATCC MYA-4622 / CBS 123669 / FGSC 9596 / NRRL 45880 / 77-13-4) TaxID=660122 RepID=C7Z986_FUSV7|nr:uncharacterized protein NECHADRAFT_81593 [Fusarium vanettenii 77-13-4]EEU39013.1 predicted protein [Fusarium vanettenii 77-13-4]